MLQVLISCGFKGNFARKLPVRRGVGGVMGGLQPGVIFKMVIGFGESFSDKGVLPGGSF